MLKRGLGCLLGALLLLGAFTSAAQGERPYQAVYLEVFKTENRQFTTGARLLVVEGSDEGHQARTIDLPSAFVRPESFVLDHLVSDDLRYVLLFQYSSAPLNAGAYDLHSLTLVDLES